MTCDLGSDLRKEREKLLKRLRDYRKYKIPDTCAFLGGYALSIYLAFTNVSLQAEFEIGQLWFFSPIVVGFLVSLTLSHFARPHKLTDEEVAFLKVCSTLESLGNYLEDEREPDRKRAKKTVNKVAREIEKWNTGKLQLCKKVIGSHMRLFREAFVTKLVGAIKQGKKNDLQHAYQILTAFAKYLLDDEPKVDTLEGMTKAMNEMITVAVPLKAGLGKRAYNSLREATPVRFAFVITTSIVTGIVIGFTGYVVLHVPIEYAYTMAVTVALAIVGFYITYLRKSA